MPAMSSDSVGQCETGTFGLHGTVVRAWGQGFMMGAIVILLFLTLANMRRAILHILILAELILASLHGTFVFIEGPAYGWYLSTTAALLYISYNIHNVVNWIKVKPFLPKWGSRLYIITVILAWPYWIAEIYLNFSYNNDLGTGAFQQTRPWEALFREPWWIFTSLYLVYVVKRCYGIGICQLVYSSVRFGILIASMAISIAFVITDIVEVAVFPECAGKNPFWKLALVFKFAADAVFLDNFKTVLDQLTRRTMGNLVCPVPPAVAGDPEAAAQSEPRELASLQVPSSNKSNDGDGNSSVHLENWQPSLGGSSHRV
ncbi:hypothetical protein BDW59DRAFT_182115 [Aspergillus cavernicola]|uniref:Uncharacterized protein n=1 Tax=Aspergillus cavernicola TaxID=176166 RepID=A0ABR4IX54_9EURO